MSPQLFYIIHVFSVLCLLGVCSACAAHPLPDRRKKLLMYSGIASLLVFLSGFGLAGILKHGFPGWVIVKIICWLVVSGLVGMYFRQPQKAGNYLAISFTAALVALIMVYIRPF